MDYMNRMFADLLTRLTAPRPATLAPDDARLALAALMVRVARADGTFSKDEADRIDASLAARYGLDSKAATDLRRKAMALENEAPDTVRFTRAIKEAVAHEDRVAVIEALWSVVLADGIRDHEENTQLRLMANLLGINDRDSNLARQRVSAGPGGG